MWPLLFIFIGGRITEVFLYGVYFQGYISSCIGYTVVEIQSTFRIHEVQVGLRKTH